MPVDLNRGVTIRITAGGMRVHMYKDEPGVYRTVTGALLSEKVAFEAGFPVQELGQTREIQLRKTAAFAAIENEFDKVSEEKLIKEAGGFQVIALGLGRHEVRDPNGVTLTEAPMSRKESLLLLSKLAPADVEVVDTPEPAPSPSEQ